MLWLDGNLHEQNIVPFDVTDRGLLLGDGIFDTSLVLDGHMVWRDAHVARLVAAAKILGFSVDRGIVDTAIDAILARTKHGTLRLTITRGSGPRGLAPPADPKPTFLAILNPFRSAALFAPLKLHVASMRRNETSPIARVKSLNYLDGVLASRDAIAAGYDDAVFLNTKDRVTCTTVGNVMALIGDQLVTPPVEDGIVAGTARNVLLRTCEDLGLEAIERSLSLDDLDAADEILVTNSLRLVAPVVSLGRKTRASAGERAEAIIAHVARIVRDETCVDLRALADA